MIPSVRALVGPAAHRDTACPRAPLASRGPGPQPSSSRAAFPLSAGPRRSVLARGGYGADADVETLKAKAEGTGASGNGNGANGASANGAEDPVEAKKDAAKEAEERAKQEEQSKSMMDAMAQALQRATGFKAPPPSEPKADKPKAGEGKGEQEQEQEGVEKPKLSKAQELKAAVEAKREAVEARKAEAEAKRRAEAEARVAAEAKEKEAEAKRRADELEAKRAEMEAAKKDAEATRLAIEGEKKAVEEALAKLKTEKGDLEGKLESALKAAQDAEDRIKALEGEKESTEKARMAAEERAAKAAEDKKVAELAALEAAEAKKVVEEKAEVVGSRTVDIEARMREQKEKHRGEIEALEKEIDALQLENARLEKQNLVLRGSLGMSEEDAQSILDDYERTGDFTKWTPKTEEQLIEQANAAAAAAAVPAPAPGAPPRGSSASEYEDMTEDEIVALLTEGVAWPNKGDRFWEHSPRLTPVPLALGDVGGGALAERTPDPMPVHVVHVTAEMAPIAKVGGLGDVVTGLSKEMLARGNTVEVILPYYECLEQHCGGAVMTDPVLETTFDCPKGTVWDGQLQLGSLRTDVYRCEIDGVPVALVRPDWGVSNLFKGDRIYGGSYNEGEAYMYFCRAALEYLLMTGRNPDVLHLHEWQTGAAAMMYWDFFFPAGLDRPRVMMTLHNVGNTGEVSQHEFGVTGFPGEHFATIDRALDERTIGHNPERLNLLKGGINYATKVTTVSPTYKTETLEQGAAGFLGETLGRHQEKYHGILNGIDIDQWNPTVDPMLPAPFSSDVISAKAITKRFVQMGLGFTVDPSIPLFVCITRLVPQKGIHLIARAMRDAAAQGGQFVLLGSGHADGEFRRMADHEFGPDSDRIKVMLFYSEALAHQLYAASDFTVVPSMFEPCGLTQMIAMRYGSVPVVRRTGGLADTVSDVDQDPEHGNGYVFDGAADPDMSSCMSRALRGYREGGDAFWEELVRRNMLRDVSWAKSAAEYSALYREMSGL